MTALLIVLLTLYVVGFVPTAYVMWRTGRGNWLSMWFRIVAPFVWPVSWGVVIFLTVAMMSAD